MLAFGVAGHSLQGSAHTGVDELVCRRRLVSEAVQFFQQNTQTLYKQTIKVTSPRKLQQQQQQTCSVQALNWCLTPLNISNMSRPIPSSSFHFQTNKSSFSRFIRI